jgi:hypothetical protein
VSAALRKAGLPQAETQGRTWRTKRVIRAGWHAWDVAGEIRVTHWTASTISPRLLSHALARYAPALAEAGWKVVEDERGGFLAVLAAPPAKEKEAGE